MKIITLLVGIFLIATQAYAQPNYNGVRYYDKIAGDTAQYCGRGLSLFPSHLGDTLLYDYPAKPGLYRMFIHPSIDIRQDLTIDILNEASQSLLSSKFDQYVEFYNPSASTLRIITHTTAAPAAEVETVGRLFYVYSTQANKPAPPFELTDMNGKVYTNDNLRDKLVVINFWGTSCGPCVREIPQLNKVAQQYATRDDVVFLAISVDSEEELDRFLEKKQFDYQLVPLASKEFKATELQESFSQIRGTPSHYVIDREGNVVFQFFGTSNQIAERLSRCIDNNI